MWHRLIPKIVLECDGFIPCDLDSAALGAVCIKEVYSLFLASLPCKFLNHCVCSGNKLLFKPDLIYMQASPVYLVG